MLGKSETHPDLPGPARQYESLQLVPLTPHVGAEIRGVDLAQPLSDTQGRDIDRAFAEWKVLVFRDQHLDREAHKAFARRYQLPVSAISRLRWPPLNVPTLAVKLVMPSFVSTAFALASAAQPPR